MPVTKPGFEYNCKSLQSINQIISLLKIQALTKTVLIKDFHAPGILGSLITLGFYMNI